VLTSASGPERPTKTEIFASAVVIAAVTGLCAYYIDPYVAFVLLPFFALGCRRGKHPLTLVALAAIPALTLLVISAVKFAITGIPLVTYDHYFLRQNVLVLAYNDWRVAAGLVLAVVGTFFYVRALARGRGPFTRFEKGGLAALTLVAFGCVATAKPFEQDVYNWNLEVNKPSIRAFLMSALIPEPELDTGGKAPAAVGQAVLGAPAGGLPDLYFVLQESTMHPDMLRPGHVPKTLFAAPPPLSGRLRVHTFAGGTWKTEFTIATQMSSQEFGSDGLYVFHQLEARIKRSIFSLLKQLGYKTLVFYPAPGSFINAEAFYRSLGVDAFHDPKSLGLGDGWDWHFADADLFNGAMQRIAAHEGPIAAVLLTINQHGPHDFNDPYADYLKRFEGTDADYAGLLRMIESRGRKAGVVAYGDHQPEFTARFFDDHDSWYHTAYDIRCIGFACTPPAMLAGHDKAPLDVTLLTSLALQTFGFGLDDFSALQLELFKDCVGNVAACDTATRQSFNAAFARYFE
jgi:hypothetical protein